MSWCLCTECPSSGGPRPGKGTPARCCLWQHDKVDFVLVGKTTDWMQQLLQGEKKRSEKSLLGACTLAGSPQEAERKEQVWPPSAVPSLSPRAYQEDSGKGTNEVRRVLVRASQSRA